MKVAVTSRSFSKHTILRQELSERYTHVTFNDTGKTLHGDLLIQFLQGHEMAIVGLERLTAEVFAMLPQLKVVSRFGAGLDTLDLQAMQQRGLRLAYTPGANKRAVAELVIAFAISMLRQLPLANQELKAGIWQQRKGRQLSGSTVGVIGLGAVGKELILLLKPFNCRILAYDLIMQPAFCHEHQIQQVSLPTLLSQSHIVSLHIPLTTTTQLLLDAKHLALLSPDAILINAARGGLVDEEVVKEMLIQKKLAAAAFDVFASEPPSDQTLLSLSNFFATPHIGGSTEEAILAMGKAAIEGLEKAVIP